MTDQQLQDLSRRAAGCLPKEMFEYSLVKNPYPEYAVTGALWKGSGAEWLHESTEACCEIMVRVLFENQIGIGPSWEGAIRAFYFGSGATVPDGIHGANDIMLAYRVAVLRALCALKEGK